MVERLDIEQNNEYKVKNYDVKLKTTIHVSQNPKYAENKKVTDIGKRYYVSLHCYVWEP